MYRSIDRFRLFLALALFCAIPAQARQSTDEQSSDRAILESTMHDVRSTVQDVFEWVGRQVEDASFAVEEYARGLSRAGDLDDVEDMLGDARRRVRTMKRDAHERGQRSVEQKLDRVEKRLDQLVREIREIEREQRRLATTDRRDDRRRHVDKARDRKRNDRRESHDRYGDHSDWSYGVDIASPEILGRFGAQPFYSPLPGLRYNRVEGFVLGLDVSPIHLTSSRRSKVFGQIGYAFALDDIRYQAGFETHLGRTWRERSRLGLKLGAAYHENTETDDTWKIDPVENSLGAFFFRNDFYDYYETEGWTAYLAKYLRPYDASVRVGFRSDDYRSLDKNTDWSIFAAEDRFRPNPAIDEGRMNSVVVQIESGDVYGFGRMPKGAAFRATAELGQDLGGDFDFNRYVFDGRVYSPLNNVTSLALRGRAGYATEAAPLQKQFTVGGVGSVRAYPQNAFIGTKLLVGNAELAFDNVDFLLADLSVFGFADVGWLGDDFDRVDIDNAIGAAGFGVGFDDRRLRFEVAWPLDDASVDGPTLWFRINPTF